MTTKTGSEINRSSGRLPLLRYGFLAAGVIVLAVLLAGATVADEGGDDQETTEASPDRYELTDDLTAGGRLRIRSEMRDGYFDSALPGNGDSFLLTQLRGNLDYRPSDSVRLFLELQDARALFEDELNDDAVPNLNEDSLDVHQAFAEFSPEAGGTRVRIRAGRQKMNLGAKRVISSLGWSNTEVVWDGVRATVGPDAERTLDVFGFTGVAPEDGAFNDWSRSGNRLFDGEYAGLYYSDNHLLNNGPVDGYLLYRENDRAEDRVYTLGGRFDQDWDHWDANAEVAVQTGDFGDTDHRAYAAHVEAGRSLDLASGSRLAALYDYASGDDDPTDGTHEMFDNIYYIPLNHAYYGFMDFFSWQNLHHAALTWSTDVREDWSVRLAYHEFWLVEERTDSWYNAGRGTVRNAGGPSVDDHVGSELDLTVSHPFDVRDQTIDVLVGYSRFFPGGYVDDTGNSSTADFFYVQATTSF